MALQVPTNRRSILISSFLAGGAILAFGILVLFPLVLSIMEDHREIIAQKQEIASLQSEDREVQSFEVQSASYARELEQLEALFISPTVPVDFIEFLENLGRSESVVLTIEPGAPQRVEPDAWPSLEFRLSLRGSYESVMRFLQSVERAAYLTEMRQLNVDSESSTDGTNVAASATFKVYTKPLP